MIVLNRSVQDSSRLLMISSLGTVFSCGIDLSIVCGQLSSSSIIESLPIHDLSSSSSTCSSNNGIVSANTDTDVHHPIITNNNNDNTGEFSKPGFHSNSFCRCDPIDCGMNLIVNFNQFDLDFIGSYFQCPNPSNLERLVNVLRSFLMKLISFPKPIVVGVNGPALGLGVAILPLCDFVYASDMASFQMPYSKLGQISEAASSYTLSQLIGMPLVSDLFIYLFCYLN